MTISQLCNCLIGTTTCRRLPPLVKAGKLSLLSRASVSLKPYEILFDNQIPMMNNKTHCEPISPLIATPAD
ncbi:hypothetical protein [Acidovorax sp. SDU_ACID1]|uniref:hypothetical protein n=1 Tax=Acidovorax sp. SDU_ACID1 TaxID=3136632 RepID=UPI0038735C54